MGSRTWIKIYCDKWLNGTIREESPELRGIWVDLLALAGSGKYGDSGEIKITDHVGFLDEQLAGLLQISRQKWATIKKKLIETDRVMTKNNNVIVIKNWSKYQSEYRRQRQYRQLDPMNEITAGGYNKKLQQKVTTESTARDRDKRIEKEIIEEEIRDTPHNPPTVSSITQEKLKKTIEDVLDAYRTNICEPSEDIESEIRHAVGRFSADWVIDAIKESTMLNKRAWYYIAGILKNWERYGKGAKFPKRQ